MDPQYQQPVYNGNSLEYLNQISSNKTPSTGFVNKKVIIIVGAVLLLLIIAVVASMSSGPTSTPSGQILGYRLTGLNELITFGESGNISDSDLSKSLAETKIVSLSNQYQISTYVSLPKADNKTPVPTDEAVTQTIDSLNKAVASGSFYKNYSNALIGQIEKIKESLLEIRSASENHDMISKIDEDLAQYEALIGRLAN
jgi:hypothetical protein